ncbi:MAG: 2-polyprenyl-3-methyl-5-hydroxy-6-metoxy,4-benzoquinol methylase [Hyphomicrobiales bacterium]|nr:2-polyprenyl-3-methyl-5-hydroxy-6-metoxy,4-benzoquinol methylase [Hyphomicrobiales bacterium]
MDETLRRAMAPTDAEIAALPLSSNAKAASELLSGRGERALDIGCGEGKFTRAVASFIPHVSGVDIKDGKIAQAQTAAADAGLAVDFRVGSGEDLPYPAGHFDIVIFSNSLHHMPTPAKALSEASRVLKGGGLLYVMEPVPAGNYFEATKLVNDETAVRTQAYRDMAELDSVEPLLESLYRSQRSFADFEDWRSDQIDRDPKRKALFDAQPDEVRSRFESCAERQDGRLVFNQVFRVNLLRKKSD